MNGTDSQMMIQPNKIKNKILLGMLTLLLNFVTIIF